MSFDRLRPLRKATAGLRYTAAAAIVSHELRSPLTAILGWCRMLRSGRLPPADGDRALDTIERSTRLQAKLVEDLLDVSRAAAGKLDITTRSVDLSAVAEQVVESHRPRADAVRVHLIGDVSGGVAVLGDAERLQQVIGIWWPTPSSSPPP